MADAQLRQREGRALGSPLRLSVAGLVEDGLVDEAWGATSDEFARVDRAMSRYRADSELTEIHRRGGHGPTLSWRLRRGLVAADRARRLTGGRFEPRILRALERLGTAAGAQPAPVQPWGDGREPAFEPGTPVVRRRARGAPFELSAPVDLGGIGKGLALRWAAGRVAATLGPSRGGATGFLLEAGGDLVVDGTVGEAPWSVAIEDPRGASAPVAAVRLESGWALATSSIRLARWRSHDGRTVHHLIDPLTAEPASGGLLAVSVAFRDPAWAEVWSKALFVEGAGGIATLARSRGLAGWWVADDGLLSMTPAARAMTFWIRAEATA